MLNSDFRKDPLIRSCSEDKLHRRPFGKLFGGPRISSQSAAKTLAVAALVPPLNQRPPLAVSTPVWCSPTGASRRLERPWAVLLTPSARQDFSTISPPSSAPPASPPAAGSVARRRHRDGGDVSQAA